MSADARRWESFALAGSFVLPAGAAGVAIRISTFDELRVLGQGPWLALILGVVVILVGVAGYGVVSARPVVMSRAGAMAFVAGFFLGVVGFLLAAAGILWVVLAGRRGSPFIINNRLLVALVIWVGVFLVGWVVHDDPVCAESGISVCTSDAVVWWEATVGLSLGGLAALVVLGGGRDAPPNPEEKVADSLAAC